MSQTRTCPVCGVKGLPPNCGNCPQCDADLTCFQALDSLANDKVVNTTKAADRSKRKVPWAAVALIAGAVLLLLAALAMSMKSRLSELDRELTAIRVEREKQQQEKPVSAPVAVKPSLPPESKIHIDARVRILDEREEAARAAAATANPAGNEAADTTQSAAANEEKKIAEHHDKPIVAAPKKAEQKPAVNLGAAEQQAEEAKESLGHGKTVAAVSKERKQNVEAARQQGEQSAAALQTEKKQKQKIAKVVNELIQEELSDIAAPAAKKAEIFPIAQTAEGTATASSTTAASQAASPQSSAVTNLPAEQLAAPSALPLVPLDIHPKQRKQRLAQQTSAAASNLQTAEPPSVAIPLSDSTFSYLVNDGETAWDIAKRFYGDRKYYPVVIEQNPHIFLSFIRKNSVVRLFSDRRAAAAFYQRKIERQDSLLLWKYEVRPGETWRLIYARFFIPRYSGMIFYGDPSVTPGRTVRIILR